MKRVTPTVSSFPREFLLLGFLILLAVLALVGGTATSAKKKADQDKEATQNAAPLNIRSEALMQPFDYEGFVAREKNGEFPSQAGAAPSVASSNVLINNNAGSTGTANYTQSESSIVAFGSTVIVAFNDSGSNAGGTNKFTGFSRSIDGGVTFTDGGTLPTNANGDAGDPVLARSNTTGRVFLGTLTFADNGLDVFHSDDGGLTWSAPVPGTPGKAAGQDKLWITVDNFSGGGNGNLYLVERDFGPGAGIFFFRSTDNGTTFGPSGGTLITAGNQGAFVTVGPDHSVYVFWYNGTTLQMRKSTDTGFTFGAAVTVASGLIGGVNGDLGLTGIRQGTATASGFRTSEFPHAAVNPVNGNLYVTYANKGAGSDKADIFLVQSTTGGATWGAPVKVNDDATTTDQWQPTLATDGTTLGIFYYSRQEDPAGNNLFKYYARLADISGATLTFQTSFAVSSTASLPEFGRDSVVNSVYMGDYNFAFATPEGIHLAWSDNRDDLPGGAPRKDPNVYYASINLKLHVTTTVPAVGSVVSSQPTSFTVNVSEPVTPGTLQASDFQVNGIPATSVSYVPGATTMTFTFASTPVTAQGLQTMHINAGAFTSAAAGDPVAVFDGTFRYDVILLQVVSTSPPFPGGVFTLPSPLTYDVNFNEAIDPTSVATSDLTLSGIGGSSVTGVTVLPGNMTARFTLSVPAEGTLTASIAAGAINDAFGNPGAAFSANYVVDIGTVPYPTPLTSKNPVGSLIYDPNVSGTIAPAGDTDSFTLPVDPAQTITVLVIATSPGLQPTVTLQDPSSSVIGSATAAGAGQNALIQTAPAVTGGTYTMTVGGAGGTTGNYTLQVILNAAQELEGTLVGVTNNTLATAQDINNSFITLQTSQASAQRGAAVGTTDGAAYSAAATPFAFEDISATGTTIAGLTGQDDASVPIPIGFTFPLFAVNNTTVFVSSNGLLTFGAADTTFTNADLTTAPALAAIAAFWDDQIVTGSANSKVLFQVLGSGSNQHVTIQWNQVSFFSGGTAGDTITYEAQLYADGRIQLNYLDLLSGAAAGNNGASATVGIKAAGTQGPNRLLLAFNNGPNAFVGTGQSTLISQPQTEDWYSVSVGATGALQVETSTPADGPGEFVNTLNPHIELYNPASVLIASGTTLGDGRNESIVSSGLAPGSYRIRVLAEGNTTGEYFLTASGGASTVVGAGSTLVNESCPPANGAVDPGETGTLTLRLQNTGGTSTTNLVATLQSSANVLAPSGPQSYGAIAPGGIVGRDFTFTANGSVGDIITLTLQLQDGATNLGTATYTLTLGSNTACAGAPRISTATTFSCSGSNIVASITISNSGTANANNVMLTTAKLGGVNGTPLPQSVGTLTPGASSVKVVTFTGAPSGITTLQVGGTFTGGTFNSSRRVTAPSCP